MPSEITTYIDESSTNKPAEEQGAIETFETAISSLKERTGAEVSTLTGEAQEVYDALCDNIDDHTPIINHTRFSQIVTRTLAISAVVGRLSFGINAFNESATNVHGSRPIQEHAVVLDAPPDYGKVDFSFSSPVESISSLGHFEEVQSDEIERNPAVESNIGKTALIILLGDDIYDLGPGAAFDVLASMAEAQGRSVSSVLANTYIAATEPITNEVAYDFDRDGTTDIDLNLFGYSNTADATEAFTNLLNQIKQRTEAGEVSNIILYSLTHGREDYNSGDLDMIIKQLPYGQVVALNENIVNTWIQSLPENIPVTVIAEQCNGGTMPRGTTSPSNMNRNVTVVTAADWDRLASSQDLFGLQQMHAVLPYGEIFNAEAVSPTLTFDSNPTLQTSGKPIVSFEDYANSNIRDLVGSVGHEIGGNVSPRGSFVQHDLPNGTTELVFTSFLDSVSGSRLSEVSSSPNVTITVDTYHIGIYDQLDNSRKFTMTVELSPDITVTDYISAVAELTHVTGGSIEVYDLPIDFSSRGFTGSCVKLRPASEITTTNAGYKNILHIPVINECSDIQPLLAQIQQLKRSDKYAISNIAPVGSPVVYSGEAKNVLMDLPQGVSTIDVEVTQPWGINASSGDTIAVDSPEIILYLFDRRGLEPRGDQEIKWVLDRIPDEVTPTRIYLPLVIR